jgi:hypothetical protein
MSVTRAGGQYDTQMLHLMQLSRVCSGRWVIAVTLDWLATER